MINVNIFLTKVPRPDQKAEHLGLTVLDEPRAKQSDPTVLDLQLRTLTKQTTTKPMVTIIISKDSTEVYRDICNIIYFVVTFVFICYLQMVHSIAEPEKQTKEVDSWIDNIR